MRKSFRWLSLFLVPALVVSLSALMAACGGDDEEEDGADVTLTGSNPADGAEVPEGATVTLTFDGDPGTVTVNGAAATGAGNSRTFAIGSEGAITVTWDTGSATLNFTVLPPDNEAPELVSSSISDGDDDVDPAGPNADGITLEFNEEISAEITLSSGGANLQWIASEDGTTVTLLPNQNNPLVNEKEYEIAGTVSDASGNETTVSITFMTPPKE